MKKDLYFTIIKYVFDKYGVNIEANVTGVFDSYFDEDPTNTLWDVKVKQIDKFLRKMQNNGHLSYTRDEKDQVFVILLINGLEYLDRHELSISNVELNISNRLVNDASLKNYKSQKMFSRATIAVALIAAIFSIAAYLKPEPKMAELNKNIQGLSKQTQGIKLQIESLRNQLPFLPDSSRKH